MKLTLLMFGTSRTNFSSLVGHELIKLAELVK